MDIRETTATYFLLMSMLCIMVGCGKQVPYEVVLQKAENTYELMAERYAEERGVLSGASDSKKITKQLGKIIHDKRFKRTWFDVLDTYGLTAQEIPFHRYVSNLSRDMSKLKKRHKSVVKKDPGAAFLSEHMQKVLDDLALIKIYAMKHKDYKEENRYIRQQRMLGECRDKLRDPILAKAS